MRQCIFCGNEIDAKAPPEHVIPKWVAREYPNAIFTTKHLDGLTINSKFIEITVGTVCKACNHHWMSDLETWASPILKPMLNGETQGLSVEQQVTLSQWATKTAMTLDQTVPTGQRVFSAGECKLLMERKLPPPGTGVQFGRYVGEGVFLDFGHNDLYRRAIPPGPRRNPPDGHRTAIRIDQLVVEVNVTSDAHLDLRTVQTDVRDLLLPIWPSTEPVAWPPKIAMSDATWKSFVAPELPDVPQ